MTSTFSFARVRECNNYDSRDGVSYKYINCINKNFIKFSQDIDVDFFICNTFGGRNNTQYIDCINRNFSIAGTQLNTSIEYCSNWNRGRDEFPQRLSNNFQYCVNRNFRQIDFLIR